MPDPERVLRYLDIATFPQFSKPKSLFIPSLVGLVKNSPSDPGLTDFLNESKISGSQLVQKYDSLSSRQKAALFSRDHRAAGQLAGSFRDMILESVKTAASELNKERAVIRQQVREKVSELRTKSPFEVLQLTPKTYQELTAVQKYLAMTSPRSCCESRTAENETPKDPKKYALKVTELFCLQTEDSGEDEAYFVGVSVDSDGIQFCDRSPVWDMNEDDPVLERLHPHWYFYYPKDPGGFLDASLALYDEDGGAEAAGDICSAVGNALSTGGGGVAIAGGALVVIGEIIGFIASLDKDDWLGSNQFTYDTADSLQNHVGTTSVQYLLDDASYRAMVQLIAIQ